MIEKEWRIDMADGIRITSEELRHTGSCMRQLNRSMREHLNQIHSEMNRLSDTWQSDAGSQIRERFAAMRPAFEEYQKVIEQYVIFLDNTATNYEMAEQAIYKQAAQF